MCTALWHVHSLYADTAPVDTVKCVAWHDRRMHAPTSIPVAYVHFWRKPRLRVPYHKGSCIFSYIWTSELTLRRAIAWCTLLMDMAMKQSWPMTLMSTLLPA